MKKIFAIITVVTLLLSLCSVAAFAAEQPTVRVSQETAAPGETAAVEVSIENNPGIVTMTLKVEFDETVLTLKGAEDKGGLGNAAHKRELESPYILRWSNNTVKENYTFNGTAAVLTFEVAEGAADGVYPVTVSYDYDNYDIIDWQMNKINFSVANGSVTVENTGTDTPDTDGVSVSGAISGFVNNNDEVTVQLIPEGETEALYEVTANGETQNYTLNAVIPGTYTLKVTSEKYDSVTAEITVEDSAVTKDITIKAKFRLTTASMMLDNSISLFFGMNATLETAEGYKDFYIKVTRPNASGETAEEIIYPASEGGNYINYSGKYRFYLGLFPEQLGDTLTAVLYAKDANGNEVHSAPVEYGAYKYATSQLSKGNDKFKSLIVALFNYGDEAQKYRPYKADDLCSVKAGITNEIKAQYLPADRTYVKIADKDYSVIQNAKAEFKTATLQLNDTIDVYYTFAINDASINVNDLKIKFEIMNADDSAAAGTYWYTPADHDFKYIESTGRYQVRFEELIANRMSNRILATIYKGDTAVSNTLSYSVESYVEGKTTDATLGGITTAIIKYGDAAKVYTS